LRTQIAGLLFVCAAASPALMGFSNGPVPGRTGAPIDGGLSCTACHATFAPANSDARGFFRLEALPYKPGVKQMIRIILQHPEAQRWGFQLTARLASNEALKAGTFTLANSFAITCGGGQPAGNCGNATEFIEHTQPLTYAGVTGGVVWEVEWTPPASDMGEVVFYAAGNAANGNLNNQGDRIYTTSLRQVAEADCNLAATPTVTAVRNGASFADSGFALNTLISVGGTGFQPAGTTRPVAAADIYNSRFPTKLNCVAVEVGGQTAPITYADSGQINAQIPTITALGDVQLRVIANPGTANERRSAPVNVRLGDYGPALFRFLPTANAAAIFASNGELASDPAAVASATKPKIGDVISLFATGLGVSEPVYSAGEVLGRNATPRARDQVTVLFNGVVMQASDILYIGLTPGSISGLWQLNLRVPANATPNANNAVALRVGGITSASGVVIPVGN